MNNKGFTLIELIAVLAIMGILFTIGIATFNFKGNTEEDTKKVNINTVEKAINVYYKILSQKGKLNYSKDSEETAFCVSYENLVKNGYLVESKIPTDENGNKYKYATVTIKNNQLAYVNTNLTESCKKEKTNITPIKNKSGNQGENQDDTETVNSYEFNSTINQTSENTYKVDSKFRMTISQNIDITEYRPIFTFIALDRSGSMDGYPIIYAASAIKSLTEDLNKINSEDAPNPDKPNNKPIYCTSVIQFQSSASVETSFTDLVISPNTDAPGGTYYSSALQVINDTMFPNLNQYISTENCRKRVDNALFFILFLSDGLPGDYYGQSNNLKSYTETLKQKGVYFFTISYGQSDNTHLKCMASKVLGENETYTDADYKLCNTYSDASKLIGYNATGTGTKVFYFESSQQQSSLSEIFKTFSTVARKESQKTEYDKINITFTINNKYFKLDNNSKEFKSSLNIDSMETKFLTSKNDFNITLINDNFEGREIKLFKSIKLEFIDYDGKVDNKTVEVPENQLPKVNVYKYKDTLIN